ncbi:MAG: hypothetical protein EPO24_02400, partial [Bacteroidetes bacterium]
MATFIHNPYSGENYSSQWKRHLQDSSYIDDVTGAIHQFSHEAKRAIEFASAEQASSIREYARIVSGSLEEGFEQLSSYVEDVKCAVNEVGALLDWRMTLLLEEQRVTNLLAENIALLLRIPDFQKERQYYIDQGFKHLKNASIDNDLYNDALENLLRAEQLEKTDYLVLHYLGYIYLRGTPCIDFAKAEDYLRRAAKYAVVETDARAERLVNILAGDMKRSLSELSSPPTAINRFAADSFYLASIACYHQKKFSEAAELAEKAFMLTPDFLEAGFTQAKALLEMRKGKEAVPILEGLIRKDWTYSFKLAFEVAAAPSQDVQQLLIQLRDEVNRKASEQFAECKNVMIPKSLANDAIVEIAELVSRQTYRCGLIACEKLAEKRKWESVEQLFSVSEFSLYEKSKVEEATQRYYKCKKEILADSVALHEINEIENLVKQQSVLASLEAIKILTEPITRVIQTVQPGYLKSIKNIEFPATIRSLTFNLEKDKVACILSNGSLIIVDCINGIILKEFTYPDNRMLCCSFSPDSQYLVRLNSFNDADKSAYIDILDIENNTVVETFEDYSQLNYALNFIAQIVWSPNSEIIAASFNNKILIWWGVDKNSKYYMYAPDYLVGLDFASHGYMLVAITTSQTLVCDVRDGKLINKEAENIYQPADAEISKIFVWNIRAKNKIL